MTEQLTPDHVQKALDELGLDIKIHFFDVPTATSQQAADAIGTELGSIVKSLCFIVAGEPVVVLASGDRRVDDRKLGALRGVSRKKVKIATPEQCVEAVGYPPGSVPPVGHKNKVPIYIDDSLARYEIVYAAAGAPNAIFPIPYETLVKATGGQVVDIAKKG